MKYIKYLFVLVAAVILAACGGGGGSAGTNPNHPATALNTNIPAGLVISAGGAETFSIAGGVAPYSAVSSNQAVLVVAVSGSAITIGGVSSGTANVVVRDSAGTSVSASVVIGSGTPVSLYVAAPSSVTVVKGTSSEYSVGGGKAPYKVASSNTAVASASLSGSTLFLTANALGSASLLVTDAAGASVSLSVTVGTVPSTPITSLPSSATGVVGDKLTFVLSGGAPAYTASSSNAAIATATVSGSQMTVTLIKVGTTPIVITDSLGNSISVSVTATAPVTTALALAPASFTVSEGSLNSVLLTVAGGTAPYTAYTSNLVLSSTSVSGATVSVGLGSQGDRCVATNTTLTITVVDSAGASSTSAMTIADNNGAGGCAPAGALAVDGSSVPAPVAIVVGGTRTFSVSGGVAPYTVTSSDATKATASLSNGGTLTITGVAAGSATVTVKDTAGTTVTITVNVS